MQSMFPAILQPRCSPPNPARSRAWRCWGVPALLALLASACFRPDIVTTRIDLPQLRSAECAERAGQALAQFERDALIEVTFDAGARQAVITYDRRRLALKNIEYALTRAGFDANQETATDEARTTLPAGCR